MSEMTEMVQTFISDSQTLAEEFHELTDGFESGQASTETIGAIFRAVHSMKGGSGFLIGEDARLAVLNKFCHEFENFLSLVRDGKIKVDPEVGRLINKGLDAVADDLDRLEGGQTINSHQDILGDLAAFSMVEVEVRDNLVIFHVAKDIKMQGEVDRFIAIATKEIEETKKRKIVVDLQGKFKLSSLAFGSIFGFIDQVEKIFFCKPSAFMKTVLQRFGGNNPKIGVVNSIEECGD